MDSARALAAGLLLTAALAPCCRDASPQVTSASLAVQVVWADDGAPAPDVGFEVRAASDIARAHRLAPALAAGRSGADGRARLDGLPATEVLVLSDRGESCRARLTEGAVAAARLDVARGRDVAVQVVEAGAGPVADAWIRLAAPFTSAPGLDVARTDAEGRALVPRLRRGQRLGAWKPGHRPARAEPMLSSSDDAPALQLFLGPGGARVEGVVRDVRGAPVAGAVLRFETEIGAALVQPHGRLSDAPLPRTVVTDAAGRFALEGLDPGRCELRATRADLATLRKTIHLPTWPARSLDLVIVDTAAVTGVLRGPAGEPVAHTRVTIDGRHLDASARSDAEGRFEARGLEPGAVTLRAENDFFGVAEEQVLLLQGHERTWEPVLRGAGPITGRLLDERGEPLADWTVHASFQPDRGAQQLGPSARSADDGRFTILGAGVGATGLVVREPAAEFGHPNLVVDGVAESRSDHVLRVPDARRATSWIEGRFEFVAPLAAQQARVFLHLADGPGAELLEIGSFDFLELDSGFRVGPLVPGDYDLDLGAPGSAEHFAPRVALAAGEARDLGVVRLGVGGRARVRAELEDGTPVVDCDLSLNRPGRRSRSLATGRPGGGSSSIAAGEHTFVLSARGLATASTRATIVDGQETLLEFRMRPGLSRRLVFVAPAGANLDGVYSWRLRDAAGALVEAYDYQRAGSNDGRRTVDTDVLDVGTYHFEVRFGPALSASGTFRVDSSGPQRAPLEFALR